MRDTDDGPRAGRALVGVSLAVLLAASVWFSGTALVPPLRAQWGLSDAQAAWLTISVQLGFISGTLLYAVLNVADVFNARRVFFVSALLAAAFNAGFAWLSRGWASALAFRFLSGIVMAGIYPVGMKIVASWFTSGLGWRLGVLVGALALGKAAPYLVHGLASSADWRVLATSASAGAVAGGLLVLGIGDGPHLTRRAPFDARAALRVFERPAFRYSAFGYFGHMWELYAVWGLIEFFLHARLAAEGAAWAAAAPFLAFLTVGVGTLGCLGGGWISRTVGERRVALGALLASASLCLLSGWAYRLPAPVLVVYLLVWGVAVIADSPQFSALAARHCPPEYTGTALTVQNGVGFLVTVGSLQVLPLLAGVVGWRWAFVALAPGPMFGAWAMHRLARYDVADTGGTEAAGTAAR
jgi:MFS family permease